MYFVVFFSAMLVRLEQDTLVMGLSAMVRGQ
jgi:hypothetical protein